MSEDVVLSDDNYLVTASGRRLSDTQLDLSNDTIDWAHRGVNNLRRRVMTQDGSNSFVAQVSGDNIRFTAQAAGANQREAWELPDTISADSEIVSLLQLPSALATSVSQWGNIHRLRYDSDAGIWRAFVCWTDTTIPIPTLINFGVITFNAGPTMPINNIGQNGISQALNVLRYVPALRAQRASNVVTLHTAVPWLPPVGSTGNFVTNTDTTFHITGGTITAADQSLRTISYAQIAANATDAVAGGQWQPATLWATLPFYLGSRLIGNTLTCKLWRPEEIEPDWTDATRTASFTFSGGDPAPHSGNGAAALWIAHLASGQFLQFGRIRWRQL